MGPHSAYLSQLIRDRNHHYQDEHESRDDTPSCSYASEVSRLASFNRSWFRNDPNFALWFDPIIWARNGFFCKISNKILQCFSCEKTVDYLARSCDPSSLSTHFECCGLVRGTETTNKPISEWKPKDCEKHDCEYNEYHRLATFHSSATKLQWFACELAEEGFCYLKDGNKAKCFSCGNIISEEQLSCSDDPRDRKWHAEHCAMTDEREAKNRPLQDRKKANDMDTIRCVNPSFQPLACPGPVSV